MNTNLKTILKKGCSAAGVCINALIMAVFGQILGVLITQMPYCFVMSAMGKECVVSDYGQTAFLYISDIGIFIILFAIIGFRKKNHFILHELGTGSSGNNVKMIGFGALLGFCMNGFCILMAWLAKDVSFTWMGFHPFQLLIILVCVGIQSSAEEFICRGYMYQKFRKLYQNPWIAIVGNSLFFSALHLLNPDVTVLSFINLLLAGILFSLTVYCFNSLWCACAVHTLWNFTQNILFGLPNSGILVPFSMFQLNTLTAKNGFCYNTGFGVEGCMLCGIVLILVCAGILFWEHKQKLSESSDKIQQEINSKSRASEISV